MISFKLIIQLIRFFHLRPVYDGEYYYDFENCLRYVYPYDFKFQAYAKKRW